MEHYPDIQRRDGTLFFTCPASDRAAIATSIERLIDLLDATDSDPDLEPYLAGFDHQTGDREDDAGDEREADTSDDEPTLGAVNDYHGGSQERWAMTWGQDECEEENEHGGDILDERHDGEGDDEPNGDEIDYSCPDDMGFPSLLGTGTGSAIALDMIRGLPIAARRADAYALVGVPLVYQFAGGRHAR